MDVAQPEQTENDACNSWANPPVFFDFGESNLDLRDITKYIGSNADASEHKKKVCFPRSRYPDRAKETVKKLSKDVVSAFASVGIQMRVGKSVE